MQSTTTARLPGIVFKPEPPRLREPLPRMDIAAFVGFAASGPIDVPVPVEDITRFREIFGADLRLAWDAERQQMQYAHLGVAVEAFFRNGGRRCWVVRVTQRHHTTGQSLATSNHFVVPGLVGVHPEHVTLAVARAASQGSWSDGLRVSAMQQSQPLTVVRCLANEQMYVIDFEDTAEPIVPHDLVLLRFANHQVWLFAFVDTVRRESPRHARVQAQKAQCFWFLRQMQASPPPAVASATLIAPHETLDVLVTRLTLPADEDVPYEVELDARELAPGKAPVVGEILRIVFANAPTLFLPIEAQTEIASFDDTVHIRTTQGYWYISHASGEARAFMSPPQLPAAERLTFRMRAWPDDKSSVQMDSLAFHSDHPRAWTQLPTDREVFWPAYRREGSFAPSQLFRDAAAPRFPLAGPESKAAMYLPLGMPRLPDATAALGPVQAPGAHTALSRDGLEVFNAALFLDPDLRDIGLRALLPEANHKLYLQQPENHTQGEPLLGLHSLLPLDEVTLVAVPDAVHTGWEARAAQPSPDPLPAPYLHLQPVTHQPEAYQLAWSAVSQNATYIVEEATDPTFTRSRIVYTGEATASMMARHPECPQWYYYRVRAALGGQTTPWSNTVSRRVPTQDFEACDAVVLTAPGLDLLPSSSPPEAESTLSWTEVDGATQYVVEEATDPGFVTPNLIYTGPGRRCTIRRRTDGVYYYRARAEHDTVSGPWSNTVSQVAPTPGWVMHARSIYTDTDLLAVHRAMLRMYAARGDLLAVLTLPRHYREPETVSHVATLVPPQNSEAEALSYAALYHPWTVMRMHEGNPETFLRAVPPDGPVCGAMAATALARGAWIAPANTPFDGVLSLDPDFSRDAWQTLYESQVNLLRRDPRGFLVMSAQTLSASDDLRPINVRRLLILLRRLALREGTTFVFEPNSSNFRRAVQRRFEQFLDELYVRGAFAGRTPETAYRVVTDESVNTRTSIEQGRFIVEMRVAPSRPLAFITVRLIQEGPGGLTIQER